MDFPELSNCLLIQSRFPLSSPRDMSTVGEEFLDCSCLFSWFLKSLDNRFNCIDEKARGKIGASIRTFFSFLLMLLRFNHKCLSVATRCCHSPERQICGPVQFANRSGYYRNLGSLRAGTRHHREFLRYENSFPPTFPEGLLAHASPNDWPIVANFSSGSQRRRSLSLPVLTLIFPALLPCLVRDSLCTALQTKILWINWSLNAIDTIETWEPDCPDGTFAAGYTMDARERWRIVCLAALSVEDIDIYLFATMITGILLIGLGFSLGYRRIQKTGTAVQSPTSLPVWLKLWEERSALRLNYNRNMDSTKEKFTALQREID